MAERPALLLLAAALAATLGTKLLLLPRETAPTAEATLVRRQAAIARWLEAQRFTIVDRGDSARPFVAAVRGRCALSVVLAHPAGFHRALVHRFEDTADETFFIYRGRRHSEQPVWRSWLDEQVARRRRDIGIEAPARPVLGVVASGCAGLDLPWAAAEGAATV